MSCGKPGGTAAEQRPVSRIYRVNLETSSLSGWVGATAAALQPLVDALATHVHGRFVRLMTIEQK